MTYHERARDRRGVLEGCLGRCGQRPLSPTWERDRVRGQTTGYRVSQDRSPSPFEGEGTRETPKTHLQDLLLKAYEEGRRSTRAFSLMASPSRVVLLTFLLTAVPAASAAAQAACDASHLEQAMSLYEFGWFDEAFDLLKPCVPGGFAESAQRASAYQLMARFYIATDSLEHARLWVKQLLRVEPRYRPDPQVEGLLFADMVQDLKPRWYTWLWKGNAWYKWAGRGLLITGVASLPFLLQGHEEPDLPEPPADPPR